MDPGEDGKLETPSTFLHFQKSETKHQVHGCREEWKGKEGQRAAVNSRL
jgi:hypothetical protein